MAGNMGKKLLFLIAFIMVGISVKGQVSSYSFYQTNGTYSPITGGIVVGLNVDDGTVYDSIPIGFNFNFNNTNFDMFSLTTNGYIVLGPDTGIVNHYAGASVLSSGNTMNNVIAAFNDNLGIGLITQADGNSGSNLLTNVNSVIGLKVGDIIDAQGNFLPFGTTITAISGDTITMSNSSFATFTQDIIQFGNGEMRVQTIGTAPNRVCVIQWTNAHKSADINDCYNFQIRLEETTGRIQTIYNVLNNNLSPWEVQVGLSGFSRADFNIRTTATDWSNTVAGTTNTKTCSTAVNIIPPIGLTFNWEKCVLPSAPVLNANASGICEGSSVALTIVTGSLNGANNWAWFADSCNGSQVGTGNIISVSPTVTTTYYARGVGGCAANNGPCGSVTVNVFPKPTLNINVTPSNGFVCQGGTAVLNATGAQTYNWTNSIVNNVAFSPTISNTYTVTGNSANGCTNTATATINVDTFSAIIYNNIPANTIVCSGQLLTLDATNIVAPVWSNGVSNGVAFAPAISGIYSVSATNVAGCTVNGTVAVTVNATPTLNVATTPTTNVVCAGGSFVVNTTGAPNLVYSPTIGNNTAFTPGASTVYTVVGTAANGCTKSSTISVTVISLSTVTVTSTPSNNAVCVGSPMNLLASGATTYSWSGGVVNGNNFNPNATQTYTLTASSSGCSTTSTITVVVNALPNVIIQAIPNNAIVCSGNTMTLNGIGAVSYVWNPSITNNVGFVPTSSAIYTVVGTNAAGCTKTATRSVTVNNVATLSVSTTPTIPNICVGGSLVLNATTNGTSIVWSPTYTNNTVFSPTSSSIYTVTVSNAANCSRTSTVNVQVNSVPTVNVVSTPANLEVCSGQSIAVTGTGAATYVFSGNIQNGVGVVVPTTTIFTVTGSDAIGCSATKTFTVVVNPLPNISINANPIGANVCLGSNLTLSGNGGVTYSWTNGISNGVPFQPTIIGTYTVIGTDAKGCANSATQFVMINQAPSISIAVNPFVNNSNKYCMNDSVALTATGATSYTWSNSIQDNVPFEVNSTTTYTVTGTDGSGCSATETVEIIANPLPVLTVATNPANPLICIGSMLTVTGSGADVIYYTGNSSQNIFDGVPFQVQQSDIYTVSGIDSNSCYNETTFSLNAITHAPISISSIPANATICSGDNFIFTASGSSAYSWSPSITNGIASTAQVSDIYTVLATDANGCTTTATKLLNVEPPLVISIDVVPFNGIVCAGSPIKLTAAGGISYSWSPNIQNGVNFNPTVSGIYTVTVTNALGCTATSTVLVTVDVAPTLSVSTLPANATVCANTPITLTASGAQNYTWSPAIQNGVAFNPTASGVYTVVGVSSTGCSASTTRTITVLLAPNVNIASLPSSGTICSGSNAILVASGASTYTYSPTYTNATSVPLFTTTTYTVTGTGSNGCTKTATRTITVLPTPAPPVITPATNQTLCANSTLIVSATSAPNTTKSWSPALTENTPFSPAIGNLQYVLTTTAVNGCRSRDTIIITGLALPNITMTKSPATNVCTGGTITLTPSGGSAYTLNPTVTGAPYITTQPSTNTIYTVVGLGANGCTKSATIAANVGIVPSFTLSTTPATACLGAPITLSTSGVSTAVSYSYPPVVVGNVTVTPINNVSFPAPGIGVTYTVVATYSVNNCTATKTIVPAINDLPNLDIVTTPINALTTPVCSGSLVTIKATSATVGTTFSIAPTVTNNVAFTALSNQIYTVTAASTQGCTKTSTVNIQVAALPTLSVSVSPSTTVCSGTPVTINATSNGNINISGSVGNNVAFIPSVSGIYTITASNAAGCQRTTTVSITVVPKPTVTVASTPTNAVVCAGKTLVLNATSAGSTISWSNGITNNVAFAPPQTAIYTVTATGANGCIATSTRLVTVNALPTLSVAVAPSNTVCAGSTITITLSSTGTLTVAQSAFTSGVPFVISATRTYTITATNAQGCTRTSTTVVTVNSSPSVAISSPNVANLCIGNSYNFIASASAGSTTTWNPTITNPVVVNASTPTAYTVTATAANGCTRSATRIYAVVNKPLINHTYTPGDSLCAGTAFTLSATSGTPGVTMASASFVASGLTFVSSFVRSGTANTTLNTNQTFANSISATFSNGCFVTKSIPLVVKPAPVNITIAGGTATVCPSGSVTLTATSTSTFPITYNWSTPFNNSVINGQGFATGNTTGTYTVTAVNNNNSCTRTSTRIVNVFSLPTLTITPASQTVVNGNTATITATGANTYVWSGGITNGVSFSPTVSTVYTVVATYSNGCTRTDSASVDVVAMKMNYDTISSQQITIAPNPTFGQTNLIVNSTSGFAGIVRLQNSIGQVVKIINTDIQRGENSIQLDLSQLPAGIYYVQLQDGDKLISSKSLLKE